MNEISVKTSFGALVAIVGGDDEFPEILVYLRKENGSELMLAAISDLSISGDEDAMRIAVYGETRDDDYSQRFLVPRGDIDSPEAMWQ